MSATVGPVVDANAASLLQAISPSSSGSPSGSLTSHSRSRSHSSVSSISDHSHTSDADESISSRGSSDDGSVSSPALSSRSSSSPSQSSSSTSPTSSPSSGSSEHSYFGELPDDLLLDYGGFGMFPATPPLSFDLLSSPLLPASLPGVLPQGMAFDPFDFAGTFPMEPAVSQLSMMSESPAVSSHDDAQELQPDGTAKDPSLPLDFTSKPMTAVDRPRAVVGSRGKGLQLVHRLSRPPIKATTRTMPRPGTGTTPNTSITSAGTSGPSHADLKARRLGYHSRGRPAGMHEGTDLQVMLHLAAAYPDLRVQTLARTILTQQEQLEARLALCQVTHERLSRMHATLLTMTDSLKSSANAHTTVAHKVVVMLQTERSRTKSHSRKSALKAALSKHPLAAMLAKRMSHALPPHAHAVPPGNVVQFPMGLTAKVKSRSKSKSKLLTHALAPPQPITSATATNATSATSVIACVTPAPPASSSLLSSSLLASDGNPLPRPPPLDNPVHHHPLLTGIASHAFVAASPHGGACRNGSSPLLPAPLTGVKRPLSAMSPDAP